MENGKVIEQDRKQTVDNAYNLIFKNFLTGKLLFDEFMNQNYK